GFRKRSCASNKLERDADSKKRHFTLAAEALRSHTHGRAAFASGPAIRGSGRHAFGAKRTSISRQPALDRSKMTQTGHRPFNVSHIGFGDIGWVLPITRACCWLRGSP